MDDAELVARLRAKTAWTNHRPYWHENNPDGPAAADRIEALTARLAKAEALAEALRKLRDCDWVISLPDRMDAVRDIARDALNAWDSDQPPPAA